MNTVKHCVLPPPPQNNKLTLILIHYRDNMRETMLSRHCGQIRTKDAGHITENISQSGGKLTILVQVNVPRGWTLLTWWSPDFINRSKFHTTMKKYQHLDVRAQKLYRLYRCSWSLEGVPSRLCYFLNFTCRENNEADIWNFQWNYSASIGWIGIKFAPHIHAAPRINCNSFYDLFIYHFMPSSGSGVRHKCDNNCDEWWIIDWMHDENEYQQLIVLWVSDVYKMQIFNDSFHCNQFVMIALQQWRTWFL